MAKAWAWQLQEISKIEGSNSFQVTLPVTFVGADVPFGNDQASVRVIFTGNETPAAMKTAITNAVIQAATDRGFTVTAGNMLLPTFGLGG